MLRKLIKYDLKATKFMWLIYVIAIGFSSLLTIFLSLADFENTWVVLVFMTLILPIYVVLVGLMMAPLVFISIRFYKHIISDQAYLTFTLPVPRYYHIVSKTITYAIWQVASTLVMILSFVMVFLGVGTANPEFFDGLNEGLFMFDMTFEQMGAYLPPFIIVMVIYFAVSLFSSPMFMFASFALGQVMMKKHKVLGAFLSYLIITTITGFITGTVSVVMEVISIFNEAALETIGGYMQYVTTTYAINALINLALGVTAYIITNHCLTKKLNLE